MTKDEILYLAVNAGITPITLERRGITPDATDEEIHAARLELAAIYTELKNKWNRAAAAIHPDSEVQ